LPQRKRLKVNQKEKKELRMATKGSRVIPWAQGVGCE
jgi:hypothetical protein